MINFEDFLKIELRAGKIMEAERVVGSEKLIKLQVDLGEKIAEGGTDLRRIIAGIGKSYEPQDLIGKTFIFVANLEPRLLMGLESQGMILAVKTESGLALLTPEKEVAPGTIAS